SITLGAVSPSIAAESWSAVKGGGKLQSILHLLSYEFFTTTASHALRGGPKARVTCLMRFSGKYHFRSANQLAQVRVTAQQPPDAIQLDRDLALILPLRWVDSNDLARLQVLHKGAAR